MKMPADGVSARQSHVYALPDEGITRAMTA